jgi:drug/metabolite transporter (DMT)-like permease
MFAIPVIALLSSMAVFGERLSRNEWFGIGCIGAGLALISADAWLGNRRGASVVEERTPLEGG